MYRTAKHESLMLGSLENKSVYDLPGIGAARGGRLESAGITTASKLASLYNRMGRDGFESFLNTTCGQNSLWTGMTIAALDEYSQSQRKVPFIPPQVKNIVCDASDGNIVISSSSNKVQKAVDGQLKDLSASIALLQSSHEQCQRSNEELSQEVNSNVHQMKKLSESVDQLLARFEQQAEANRALIEKTAANDLKIVELNRIISSQVEELKLNAETIKELNEKNVALENDKFRLLSEKINDFEMKIQNAKENRGKSNKMFTEVILSIVFVWIFIKNFFDTANEILRLN